MTLLLFTRYERELVILADTLFGVVQDKAAEIGPKIFPVPITVSDLYEERKLALRTMGFAFAGDTVSGQFTHALASTCLQNLAAPNTEKRPTVEEVASYYAACAVEIMKEFRRHRAVDHFRFDGVLFGFCDEQDRPRAFLMSARVGAEGQCEAPVSEIDLLESIPQAVGSGAAIARDRIAELQRRKVSVDPHSLMNHMIAHEDVPGVGGEVQGASCDDRGVELRPVMRFFRTVDGCPDVDFSIMGINIHRMGSLAGYAAVGSPLMVQSAERLGWIGTENCD